MTDAATWAAAAITAALLAGYEITLAAAARRRPQDIARSAHASLREDWFCAVSAHAGSEVLAVQTLRNSLMSATMTASTAVLGLMGTVTLAAPAMHASLGEPAQAMTPRLALELAAMALLFASLVASVMAVRFYNHAGFVCAMPVGCAARARWATTGSLHLRRAGVLYSWGLRQLVLVGPLVAGIVHPLAGPVAAGAAAAVLFAFDRVGRA